MNNILPKRGDAEHVTIRVEDETPKRNEYQVKLFRIVHLLLTSISFALHPLSHIRWNPPIRKTGKISSENIEKVPFWDIGSHQRKECADKIIYRRLSTSVVLAATLYDRERFLTS